MKNQRKRMASQQPHKAAARHMTPAWLAARWSKRLLASRVVHERRAIEVPGIVHEAWPRA